METYYNNFLEALSLIALREPNLIDFKGNSYVQIGMYIKDIQNRVV